MSFAPAQHRLATEVSSPTGPRRAYPLPGYAARRTRSRVVQWRRRSTSASVGTIGAVVASARELGATHRRHHAARQRLAMSTPAQRTCRFPSPSPTVGQRDDGREGPVGQDDHG